MYAIRSYYARGADADKDQSFFLWGLKSEWLNQVVWPLAGLTRAEVMDIARNAGYTPKIALSNSTGLCFSGHSDYRQTLRDLAPDALSAVQPGKFVTTDGEILGQHAGLPNYTIGQRHGLGIWTNQRWYVIGFNQNKNEVIFVITSYSIHYTKLYDLQPQKVSKKGRR